MRPCCPPAQQVMGLEAAYRDAAAATQAAHERADGIRASLDAAQAQQKRLRQQIADVKAAGRSKLANFGGRPVMELVQVGCAGQRVLSSSWAGCLLVLGGELKRRFLVPLCIHHPTPHPPPHPAMPLPPPCRPAAAQMLKRSEAQFSQPPIGPVGQYLQLEDSRCGWLLGRAATKLQMLLLWGCHPLHGLQPAGALCCQLAH